MKKKYIYSLLFVYIIGGFSFLNINFARAEAFSIHFFLNKSGNALGFDKNSSEPVSYEKRTYAPPYETEVPGQENSIRGKYFLKTLDPDGYLLFQTGFDGQAGPFSLLIPYSGTATMLKVYITSSKKEILTTDLSKFITCNNNKICEYEKGENFISCIPDCDRAKNTYSEETQKKLKESNGVIKDPETGDILLKDKSFSSSGSGTGVGSTSSFGSGSVTNSSSVTTQSSNNGAASTTSQTSKIVYIILSALLIVVIIIVVIVVLKRRKKV